MTPREIAIKAQKKRAQKLYLRKNVRNAVRVKQTLQTNRLLVLAELFKVSSKFLLYT